MRLFSKDLLYKAIEAGGGLAQVACDYNVTWYLTKNGDLYGCGSNQYGQQGNGTSGTSTSVLTFTKRASNVKDFACSQFTTWYVDNNGDLYGCGGNGSGQQGNNGTSNITTFTKRAENVKDLSCSYFTTWYIDNNGDLYGCGQGSEGQQGNNGTSNVKIFTKRAENVAQILTSGSTTWYIDNNGDLYGCGDGQYGQQGNNSTSDVTIFTKRASNVKDFSCNPYTTWYLTTSGDLYGCGYGIFGQQGNNGTSNVKIFTKRAENVKDFSCSGYTTWYIDNNGDLYGCGQGNDGQQGNNGTSYITTFTKRAENVKDLPCSYFTTWYIDNNGDLYGCGDGQYGQQGNNSTSDVTIFTKRASNVKYFSCSYYTTWYINNNGDLYGCGQGSEGQQGNGGTSDVTTFENKNQYIPTPPAVSYNYGFRIDTTNSDPTTAVTYIGDNADFTPASMDFTTGTLDYGSWENAFFQPRPVMLKYDGTVDYELDHNDFTKKLDGTPSDVSNTSYEGNCMIAFPQVWLKFFGSGNYQYVYIANWNVDGTYRCYSHYNNNGDLLDEIFVAAFEPSNISSKLRSLAGQTVLTNTSGTMMRQYAQANGNGWDFFDIGTLQMIQMLFILMFKSRDSQSKCGAGVVGASAELSTTGSTKDKGMFYSTDNTSSSTTPVKFFGIENLWGNYYRWINGLTCYKTTVFYKLCNYIADGSTAIGYNPTSSSPGYKSYTGYDGFRSSYNLGMPNASDGLMWYWPSSGYPTGGSSSTYYCDEVRCRLSSSSSNVGCAHFGSYRGNGNDAGLFFVNLNYNYRLGDSGYGASLSCKPY